MTTTITHNRACPECGLIVEWTRGPLKEVEMYNGTKIKAREMSLVCPEHGGFEPRAHDSLRRKFRSLGL